MQDRSLRVAAGHVPRACSACAVNPPTSAGFPAKPPSRHPEGPFARPIHPGACPSVTAPAPACTYMMGFRYYLPVLAVLVLIASGCAPMGQTLAPPPEPIATVIPEIDDPGHELYLDDASLSPGAYMTPDMFVVEQLREAYASWYGTPYQFGRNSRDGIDCSAFVQRVFSENFSMALSRSTSTQVNEGSEIARDELRPGDLVFFRTGRRTRHVGIYVGSGQMLHASTSRGVTVDNITSGYYDRTYWTSRRVLDSDHLASLVPERATRTEPLATTRQVVRTRPEAERSTRARRSNTDWTPPPPRMRDPVGAAEASSTRRSGW